MARPANEPGDLRWSFHTLPGSSTSANRKPLLYESIARICVGGGGCVCVGGGGGGMCVGGCVCVGGMCLGGGDVCVWGGDVVVEQVPQCSRKGLYPSNHPRRGVN